MTFLHTSSTFHVIKLFIYKVSPLYTAIKIDHIFQGFIVWFVLKKQRKLHLFLGVLVVEFGAVGLGDDFVAILLHMND